MENKKYCKHCGSLIDIDCIVCPKCGKQVEQLQTNNTSPIVINNNNNASASASAAASATAHSPTYPQAYYGRRRIGAKEP